MGMLKCREIYRYEQMCVIYLWPKLYALVWGVGARCDSSGILACQAQGGVVCNQAGPCDGDHSSVLTKLLRVQLKEGLNVPLLTKQRNRLPPDTGSIAVKWADT